MEAVANTEKAEARRHALRVHAIVESHRQWVRNRADDFGLANALFLTKFWPWFDSWGARRHGSKWKLKRTGEETEDNRIQKEVQTYNAALFPRSLKCNVKPDPRKRGDPAVKSAMLNVWVEHPDQKMAIRDVSEMAVLYPGSAFKLGIEQGTGMPIDRTYIEGVPPWELVVDRDARSYRSARYIGHLFQEPEEDVRSRYKDALAKRGITLHGSRKIDPLNGEPGSETPRPPSVATGSDPDDGIDDRYVTVFEFCNFRDSITGPDGRTYRGRLEVWILDQGGSLEFEPIAQTMLPFAGSDGEMVGHLFPLAYMHEAPYPYRGEAPIARLLPLNVALNRMNFQIMRDTQRNTRKAIGLKGAFDQDEVDNLFDGNDKNMAWSKRDDLPLDRLIHNIPHQPIAPDTLTFRNTIDAMLTRQQGPSANARGDITGATAYEVQTTQLFTEEGFKYHASLLEVTLTRLLGAVLRAFIVAGVDASDSEGGKLSPGQALAPLGTVEPDPTVATDGPTISQETAARDLPAEWADYDIECDGETYHVTRDALDGACEVVFTQSERTPVTDQAVTQFLTGPGLTTYKQYVDAAMGGDIFAEEVATQMAVRAGLPKSLHIGEIRRRMQEQEPKAPPPPPANMPGEPQEAPGGPPEAPPAPPPGPQGPEGVLLDALNQAFEALRTVANADPAARAALLGAGQHLKAALDAVQAGDLEGAKPHVLGASEALSAVEIEAEGVDVARREVAKVVRAIAADTLPQSREMNVGVGAPEVVGKA